MRRLDLWEFEDSMGRFEHRIIYVFRFCLDCESVFPTFCGVGGVVADIGGVRSASFASLANADNGEEAMFDPTLSPPLKFFLLLLS